MPDPIMTEKTVKTKVILSNGPFVGRDNPVAQASGYNAGLPDRIWGPDSFEWLLQLYEDDALTAMDLSAGTAKLYIAADATGATATEIGTGAIGSVNKYEVTFAVAAGAIPTELYGLQCVVFAVITGTSKNCTVAQRVEVVHYSTGSSGAAVSNAENYTIDAILAPTGTVVAGKIYYLADDGATWVLADPDTAKSATAELFVAQTTAPAGGMLANCIITGTFTTRGAPIYLDDAGAVTESVPAAPGDEGRAGRVVGFVRSATTARFCGHLPGGVFTVTGS